MDTDFDRASSLGFIRILVLAAVVLVALALMPQDYVLKIERTAGMAAGYIGNYVGSVTGLQGSGLSDRFYAEAAKLRAEAGALYQNAGERAGEWLGGKAREEIDKRIRELFGGQKGGLGPGVWS